MFLMMQTHGPCGLQVPRAATSRSRMRAGRKQGPEQPAREAGPTGSLCPLGLAGWPAHLLPLSLAEEPTFRCDVCDELFQSKLDLRRHKKYTCSSVGAVLYEGLGAELKAEGLGRGSSDGQAHECKDCERMFPNKYRCVPPQWVLRTSTGAPQQMPPSSMGVPPPQMLPNSTGATPPPSGCSPTPPQPVRDSRVIWPWEHRRSPEKGRGQPLSLSLVHNETRVPSSVAHLGGRYPTCSSSTGDRAGHELVAGGHRCSRL